MTALLPAPELQFIDENGAPYAGGTLAFFVPGTLTPKNTWRDAGQVTANSNPVVLDMAGRGIAYGLGDYRVQLRDQFGNLIFDQLTSSALGESAVSAFMLPVLGAADSATALGLLGVTAAIATAIGAVELLPGPKGDTGAASTVPGPKGDTGPPGVGVTGASAGLGYGNVGTYTVAQFYYDGGGSAVSPGFAPTTFYPPGTEVNASVFAASITTAWDDGSGLGWNSPPGFGPNTGTWQVMSVNQPSQFIDTVGGGDPQITNIWIINTLFQRTA